MKRIKRTEMLMMFAFVTSLRSDCQRKQVGAVISKEGRVISTGYAGPPAGEKNCEAFNCDLTIPCTRTIHAEANAILFAARHGVAINDTELYCTDSPCIDCAKLISNSGISKVYYHRLYRDPSGLNYLNDHGIRTEQCLLPENFTVQP